MTGPAEDDIRRVADEEWRHILGQTNAFLGRVQSLVGQEAPAPSPSTPEPRPSPANSDEPQVDLVSAIPRSQSAFAISFEISGRALARARATYGEPLMPRLRVLLVSGREPESFLDEPLELPGRGELELELSERASFALVSVGVIDPQGEFRSLAHAAPLPLSPAASLKETPPARFVSLPGGEAL
jgi:hypothetical protein